MTIRGRCLHLEPVGGSTTFRLLIRNERGTNSCEADFHENERPLPGDVLEIANRAGRVLTRNQAPDAGATWMAHVLDDRRLRAIGIREKVEAGIREFFLGDGFRETRTPLLVPCPGMEPHIRPFQLKSGQYLPTSPEFAMKRLLVGGLEKIFQLAPAFRLEPRSTTHSPEFLLLEWYRAYAGYEEIMSDTERLFEFLARKISGSPSLVFQGQEISVATPWPRLRVRDLFSAVGVDLVRARELRVLRAECERLGLQYSEADTWDDLYFRIWLNRIEPELPKDRAVFVARYPESQAALSVIDSDPDGSRWARRFELYAGGIELGNAFEELTDPVEQRKRFIKDMDLRERTYGESFTRSPLDEGFLGALTEGMPPSGGIAVGVDRMVMLFADEPDISKTQWLPAYSGTSD